MSRPLRPVAAGRPATSPAGEPTGTVEATSAAPAPDPRITELETRLGARDAEVVELRAELTEVQAFAERRHAALHRDFLEGQDRAAAELRTAHEQLVEADQRHAASLERYDRLAAEYERLRAELGRVAPPPRATRLVFDASYIHVHEGERILYAPSDPVPDHINPTTLPAGAVKHVLSEN